MAWYREGEGRHCTETMAGQRGLGKARGKNHRLWLFLAHMGHWENWGIQGTVILALPVACWILWKTFTL